MKNKNANLKFISLIRKNMLKSCLTCTSALIDFKGRLFVGIAQLVERCLAKAKVAGSSPVSHSIHLPYRTNERQASFFK